MVLTQLSKTHQKQLIMNQKHEHFFFEEAKLAHSN